MVDLDRVVLFGAGASLGAGHVLPEAPPLGRDLYAELSRHFPGSWGALPPELKSAFQEGFEQGMLVLWDRYSTSIAQLMQHMTLYFAQFRPDGSQADLYSKLLLEVQRSATPNGILYSTLNYEPVLELAASGVGMEVSYWEAASDPEVIPIWKLHGSCNFISKNLQMSRGVKFSAGINIEGGLIAVDPSDAIQYCLSDSGLYPAMALYMNAKPIQIGKGIISGLQQKWGDVIRSSKRVLIVGVYPYPDDTYIWEPLRQTEAEVAYVGSDEAFDDWASINRPGKNSRYLGSRWGHCFDESVSFIMEG